VYENKQWLSASLRLGPVDPAGGSNPDSHYRLIVRTRHGLPRAMLTVISCTSNCLTHTSYW